MRVVTVKLPDRYIEGLRKLIKMGVYKSRSQAIKEAVKELLHKKGVEL